MGTPKQFKPGESISAKKLNRVSKEASRGFNVGPGGGLRANSGPNGTILGRSGEQPLIYVAAQADFTILEHVSRGNCKAIYLTDRDPESSTYGTIDVFGPDIEVIDVFKFAVKNEDTFYIAWNNQCGRFERISSVQVNTTVWIRGAAGDPPTPPLYQQELRIASSNDSGIIGALANFDTMGHQIDNGQEVIAVDWARDVIGGEPDESIATTTLDGVFNLVETECV